MASNCRGRDFWSPHDRVSCERRRLQAVDVIYRRVDDTFLDPSVHKNPARTCRIDAAAYRRPTLHCQCTGPAVPIQGGLSFRTEMIRVLLNENRSSTTSGRIGASGPKIAELRAGPLRRTLFVKAGGNPCYGILIGSHATKRSGRGLLERSSREPA